MECVLAHLLLTKEILILTLKDLPNLTPTDTMPNLTLNNPYAEMLVEVYVARYVK